MDKATEIFGWAVILIVCLILAGPVMYALGVVLSFILALVMTFIGAVCVAAATGFMIAMPWVIYQLWKDPKATL